jgi:hypothetical protein
VLVAQGQKIADAIRQIGVSEVTCLASCKHLSGVTRHAWVNSSITLSMRYFRPSWVRSAAHRRGHKRLERGYSREPCSRSAPRAHCRPALRPHAPSRTVVAPRDYSYASYNDYHYDGPRQVRISVSSSLLHGYDEAEILRSSSRRSCLTGADPGHEETFLDRALDAMEPILGTEQLLLQLLDSRLEFNCPILGSPQL